MRTRALANSEQLRIAGLLGVDVEGESTTVASAKIRDATAPATRGSEPRPATERQIAYGRSLGLDLSGESLGVAHARIDDELFKRNAEALQTMNLKPGDWVKRRTTFEFRGEVIVHEEEAQVSSIHEHSLRVWFKGGNGRGGWPTQLEKLDGSPC